MKKVAFECVGNGIAFVLFALTLLFPVASYEMSTSSRGFAFSATLSTFVLLFLAYCLAYALLRRTFVKRNRLRVGLMDNMELACEDEREQAVSAKALRAAYFAAMASLAGCLFVLGLVYFFSVMTDAASAHLMYRTAVVSVTAALEIVNAVYCIAWCNAYRK